jgi:hypothetical protein
VSGMLRTGIMRKHFLVSGALMAIISNGIFGQTLSIGVKAGVPLIDSTSTHRPFDHDESRPYVVGPTVELKLPAGFAIEASGLYRRVGNTTSYGLFNNPFSLLNRVRGNSWEFPLVGKYYFWPRAAGLQPFVGTGWALRTVQFREEGTPTTADQSGMTRSFPFHNDFRSDLAVGAVVAAGLRFRAGRLAILPEVRYTRWGAANSALPRNDATLFLGITF